MKIRLDEISAEGKEFSFRTGHKELDGLFKDLKVLGYEIDLKITPLDAYFEIKGVASSKLDEVCGRCGFDIDFKLSTLMNDMILEKQADPRGSQYSRGPSVMDSRAQGPEVVHHADGVFDLGEYLHEVLALKIPDYPLCGGDQCTRDEEVSRKISQLNNESESFTDKEKTSPFEALKNLRLQ